MIKVAYYTLFPCRIVCFMDARYVRSKRFQRVNVWKYV